ncbi:MAG: hypothetical protein PHC97_02770 [Patescibacteria group bacterium]|nr:hypothetical protein [Patescibacteria group bacterium]
MKDIKAFLFFLGYCLGVGGAIVMLSSILFQNYRLHSICFYVGCVGFGLVILSVILPPRSLFKQSRINTSGKEAILKNGMKALKKKIIWLAFVDLALLVWYNLYVVFPLVSLHHLLFVVAMVEWNIALFGIILYMIFRNFFSE